ncbi:conjugative transfer protein MobI(A/C) [Photorhabdus aegyptia]|uniref:Uncharacterized protein n=1 Tax=Photorhabdus aegyptia TaxID=2805098 RepID=A0A022PNT9_9GAMM|nr:conjugative transfer protein MobI(A/C) [Photorhabdus aegyptia]EYU16553.1 hypothetical protein BA1DRAFT_00837 [Photorhabdus aegyptia]
MMDIEGYIKALEKARNALDQAADKILDEATKLRSEYWSSATSEDEKARYSFNVVKQESTIRIRWARMTPFRKAGGDIYRVVPKYLTINKGETYPVSKFKDAGPRELSLIVMYEAQLTTLRAELKKNRSIRQLISRRITENKKLL